MIDKRCLQFSTIENKPTQIFDLNLLALTNISFKIFKILENNS